MNIEGGKLASLHQAGAPTESRGPSLLDGGASPEGFADALMRQMETLGGVRGQSPGNRNIPVDTPRTNPPTGVSEDSLIPTIQPPFMSAGKPAAGEQGVNAPDGTSDGSDGSELAASMLSSLPLHPLPEKVADPLAQSIQEEAAGQASPEVSSAENRALLRGPQQPGQLQAVNNPDRVTEAGEGVKSGMEASFTDVEDGARQKIGESPAAAQAGSRKANIQGAEGESGDLAQVLSALNVLAPASTPLQEGMSGSRSATETGHETAPRSAVKPAFDEFKPNAAGDAEASEDAASKNMAFGQLVKGSQTPSPYRAERSPQAEEGYSSEAGPSVSDLDKNPSRGIADISPSNRPPIENRVEIPAMTRPLAHPDWNKDLGERILWMNNRELPSAEIKLNPEHLGPISVRIEMNNDKATIAFTAQHAAVREAIEASLPKLREMMNSQQVTLGDVNISQNHSSGQQHQSPSHHAPRNFEGVDRMPEGVAEMGEALENSGAVVSKGILSIYA